MATFSGIALISGAAVLVTAAFWHFDAASFDGLMPAQALNFRIPVLLSMIG